MSQLRWSFGWVLAAVLLASASARAAEPRQQETVVLTSAPDAFLKRLVQVAEAGDPDAQLDLGRIYELGDGVPRDYKKALEWYRRAAEQRAPAGLRATGVMYSFGLGIDQDMCAGLQWYMQAAELGDEIAMNNIGVAYQWGSCGPVDYEEAAKWYKRSADKGHMRAVANLGALYMEGRGVEKDVDKGLNMIRWVAETGDAGAMLDLASAYKDGEGVSHDNGKHCGGCGAQPRADIRLPRTSSGRRISPAIVGYVIGPKLSSGSSWLKREARRTAVLPRNTRSSCTRATISFARCLTSRWTRRNIARPRSCRRSSNDRPITPSRASTVA